MARRQANRIRVERGRHFLESRAGLLLKRAGDGKIARRDKPHKDRRTAPDAENEDENTSLHSSYNHGMNERAPASAVAVAKVFEGSLLLLVGVGFGALALVGRVGALSGGIFATALLFRLLVTFRVIRWKFPRRAASVLATAPHLYWPGYAETCFGISGDRDVGVEIHPAVSDWATIRPRYR